MRGGRQRRAVGVGVGVVLVEEVDVRLRGLQIHGARHGGRVVGGPIVAVHDLLHRGVREFRVELCLAGLVDQYVRRLVRVGQRVVVAAAHRRQESAQRVAVGGILQPSGVHGESELVRVARHPPIGGHEAVQRRPVQLAFHVLPRGVEAAEIALSVGQRLERVGACGRGLEIAGAAGGADHLPQHGGLFGGSEAHEGLAVEVLRRGDVGARGECAPAGHRLLRQVEHHLQVRALRVEGGHIAQRGEPDVGHAVLHRGLGPRLRGRQDGHVHALVIEIAELLRHIQADMVRVRRPVQHERDRRIAVGIAGRSCVVACAAGRSEEQADAQYQGGCVACHCRQPRRQVLCRTACRRGRPQCCSTERLRCVRNPQPHVVTLPFALTVRGDGGGKVRSPRVASNRHPPRLCCWTWGPAYAESVTSDADRHYGCVSGRCVARLLPPTARTGPV